MEEKEEEDSTLVFRQLQDSVKAHPQDPSVHFDLGLFLWERGTDKEKSAAAEHFLESAKLNPQNAAAFRYLGDYYATVMSDTNRAIKCYQRVVSLNPDDAQAGEAFCDVLDRVGKVSLEGAACKEASEKSPRAFWAFRRLGYLQVDQNKWPEAIQSLQHAIRGYPNCADLWEALGLAYQRLGRFTAAIKSYGRAIELEDDKVFSLVESGNIFLMLCSFKKGVEHFRKALDISPQNVSALFGLSSGLLGMGKECIKVGGFRWASSVLEEANEVAKLGTCLAGNSSCIWKLCGDIQLMYAKYFPWLEGGQDKEMDIEAFKTSILSWKQTCLTAAISAKRSYQKALHLAPWQANAYIDVAITSDVIFSLDNSCEPEGNSWSLPKKMTLGSLLLESENCEFWIVLGCLSDDNALKQHALLRGLQLDVSLAVAWAYLGQLYRKQGKKELTVQAFDNARSIDPSLAIPWAGMSADFHIREFTSDEAFECCLRAVQILPVPEFQIGLAKLALQSGNLSSSQVYGAIQQAIQRAPFYPESHNLNGLVCEARADYHSAALSYRLARWSIISCYHDPNTDVRDVSINIARSLCKGGNAMDALKECEDLKNKGMLDIEGSQIYAFSLWQLGKNNEALAVTRNIAASVSSMDNSSQATAVSFICRLLYSASGLDLTFNSIEKMPKKLFQNSKVTFIVSALHVFDRSNRLDSIVSSSRSSLTSQEEITRMHFLIALGKLVKHGSKGSLGFQSGVFHLRKYLHRYPNSSLLRNLLGYLLLSKEDGSDNHTATRCCSLYTSDQLAKEGLKSVYEIHGAGAFSCYAIGNSNPKFTFPTCTCKCQNKTGATYELQKWLRREPWNYNARYLLILNYLQKAREEKFPYHLCITLERLVTVALSYYSHPEKDKSYQYQKFQILLCASEISLQDRNLIDSINFAKSASAILLPASYSFFAHLALCRAYAAVNDAINLQIEFAKCLELKTDYNLGWICLKFIESRFLSDSNVIDIILKDNMQEMKNPRTISTVLFKLVEGLITMWKLDFTAAEKLLAESLSLASNETCLLFCHGTACIKLARESGSSQFLSDALKSLARAQAASLIPIPIISVMLAQAEGSLGSKEKWEKNLRSEWFSWPPERRPAELFLQMHLLAKQSKAEPDHFSIEFCQSPEKWVLRAIHTNPSCPRYWKVLLTQQPHCEFLWCVFTCAFAKINNWAYKGCVCEGSIRCGKTTFRLYGRRGCYLQTSTSTESTQYIWQWNWKWFSNNIPRFIVFPLRNVDYNLNDPLPAQWFISVLD